MSVVHNQPMPAVPSLWGGLFPVAPIPLFWSPVSAGFPSPADNSIEKLLDLNEYCIRNPISTYFIRIEGDSWGDLGVKEGDILIVDRGVNPGNNALVLADLDGARLLFRVGINGDTRRLIDNMDRVHEMSQEISIWGTVMWIIRGVG